MSVLLEFTVEADQFLLGQVLSVVPSMQAELERVVPTENTVMPYIWMTGASFEEFEESVADHPSVDEFVPIDRIENSTLYRGEWAEANQDGLIKGIVERRATVLDGHSDEKGHWEFRLRFRDHEDLSEFYYFCTERHIEITIIRTFTLTERTGQTRELGLSHEQREALVLALQEGYFDTPSSASLAELSEQLGITQQALSSRIRRGSKQALSEVLLSADAPASYRG